MKKLIIILFLILFLTGCTPIQAETEPVVIIETVVETVKVTVEDTDRIEQLESEIRQYRELIANLDGYLSYVYEIKCTDAIGGTGNGTAFSIEYNDEIYIISAGHLVENENGMFSDFRIQVDDKWIYLKLLDYNNDYPNKEDYAIFANKEIKYGFSVDLDNDKSLFIIGSNKTISDCKKITVKGESGSPIIDTDGEITRVVITDTYAYSTNINIVLEAIDNLN